MLICKGVDVKVPELPEPKEKPIPDYLNKIFFAETLWRLQYETKRRLARLFLSLFYYSFGVINKDLKKFLFS